MIFPDSLSFLLTQIHPQEFESLLKEVVTGKRLSASKMSKLTDIAMKYVEVRF